MTHPILMRLENAEVALGPVTNVVKLFTDLAGEVTAETKAMPDEQEKNLNDSAGVLIQCAKYMHGVATRATSSRKYWRERSALGSLHGLCGDIPTFRGNTSLAMPFIRGFSRGAYTARALAGMICAVGLLNPAKYDVTDKEKAYSWDMRPGLGRGVWCLAAVGPFRGSLPVSCMRLSFGPRRRLPRMKRLLLESQSPRWRSGIRSGPWASRFTSRGAPGCI